MSLVRQGKAISLHLCKDLVREIKRGHCWIYSDALDRLPKAPAGTVAILSDRKGERIASGIYDAEHPIPLRICRSSAPMTLDDDWLIERLRQSHRLRSTYFQASTNGFRLTNGEGDAVPGLVIDVYDATAVIKLDGGAPEHFYQPGPIAQWLRDNLGLSTVVYRSRQRGRAGEFLLGNEVREVSFLENGMRLTADVLQGQKTGFFLDQRDNRALVGRLSSQRCVLNLFSFNGGFSIAAGLGGAARVTSVDIAEQAVAAANRHWIHNELPASGHEGVVADVFEYLDAAQQSKQNWDFVICDPPSFAPGEHAKSAGLAAYARLAQATAKVTAKGGLLALASCSSHISELEFLACNTEALGRARRKAMLLATGGQPIDHPTPLAMPEMRYLKFLLFKLD